MDITNDTVLVVTLHQLVHRLLSDHAYGVSELAQACAQQLHEPLCEIMTPFCDSLCEMVNSGELCYDRQSNLVLLA